MRIELTEILWLEQHSLTQEQLAELSLLPPAVLEQLIGAGSIAPLEGGASPRFGAVALSVARRARRLRDDFELDAQGLMLALALLDRVSELEAQLRELRAKHPGRAR